MSDPKINEALIAELEKISDPQELIGEVFRRFGERAAIGTSGQLTGVVMVDLAVKAGVRPRVFTIDTLRLFSETYELFNAVEKKYGISVERIQPNLEKVQEMVKQHGEHLFFDSKEKQEYCCRIRKVEPNNKVLDTMDVWLTGLRTDQSTDRAATQKFQLITRGEDKKPILKIAPLVDWTENKLREYCQAQEVPVHKLLSWNQDGWFYESLGCVICTTPIGPKETRRSGRWRWFSLEEGGKECGLHVEHKDEV